MGGGGRTDVDPGTKPIVTRIYRTVPLTARPRTVYNTSRPPSVLEPAHLQSGSRSFIPLPPPFCFTVAHRQETGQPARQAHASSASLSRPPSHSAALRPLEVQPALPASTITALHLATTGRRSLASLADLPSGMHVHRAIGIFPHTHTSHTHPLSSPRAHTRTYTHTHICIVHVAGPTGAPHPPYSPPSKSVDAVSRPAGPPFPVALLPCRQAPHTSLQCTSKPSSSARGQENSWANNPWHVLQPPSGTGTATATATRANVYDKKEEKTTKKKCPPHLLHDPPCWPTAAAATSPNTRDETDDSGKKEGRIAHKRT